MWGICQKFQAIYLVQADIFGLGNGNARCNSQCGLLVLVSKEAKESMNEMNQNLPKNKLDIHRLRVLILGAHHMIDTIIRNVLPYDTGCLR